MATTTSNYFPLATEAYNDPGHDGVSSTGGKPDSAAGASGSSPGAVEISHGAMIAIIVVVVVVGVLGISMSVLFYVAKKREWKIRESIRKSARRVVTALTPKRSEFPKSVKQSTSQSRQGRVRLDDVPPTPRLRPEDLEKGIAKAGSKRKDGRWPRK